MLRLVGGAVGLHFHNENHFLHLCLAGLSVMTVAPEFGNGYTRSYNGAITCSNVGKCYQPVNTPSPRDAGRAPRSSDGCARSSHSTRVTRTGSSRRSSGASRRTLPKCADVAPTRGKCFIATHNFLQMAGRIAVRTWFAAAQCAQHDIIEQLGLGTSQ
jgi:hypothetical protein